MKTNLIKSLILFFLMISTILLYICFSNWLQIKIKERLVICCIAASWQKLLDTQRRWVYRKEKGQACGHRKNTTRFISVFQPLCRPVSNQEDMEWYFLVNEGISSALVNHTPPPVHKSSLSLKLKSLTCSMLVTDWLAFFLKKKPVS